jgi:hypothetical protein
MDFEEDGVIAQDTLTSHLVYVQSKLWCCILSQYLVMLQLNLNKVRGDRISCCLGFGGVDFEEDGAIATTARIPTSNSKSSNFTGNVRN